MALKITRRNEEFPLKRDDLKKGQFAQCSNGTVVFVAGTSDEPIKRTEPEVLRVVNIANGIGGYAHYTRFRLLSDADIMFSTDSDGLMIEED
jgi:hypothetical protein